MVKIMRVDELLSSHQKLLDLKWVAGKKGAHRELLHSEVHRPGLALAGFLKNYVADRPLIFGIEELLFLEELPQDKRKKSLKPLLSKKTPFVAIAGNESTPEILSKLCEEMDIPLFSTEISAGDFIASLTGILSDVFSPMMTCHGTFVEAFGVGVLIEGDSSIGKSEAALGLIERGHRLVSDDVVKLRLREDNILVGFGPDLTRHMMELRGIGIINVAHLFGAVCVRDTKSLDVIVRLEEWNDQAFYDRVGLDEKYRNFLGVDVPSHTLPVKPGRDVVLLIETIVLNHRLKMMGYHSAKEFNVKLLDTIAKKQHEKARSKSSG